ncbi:ABC transporter substrate-binding protein [Calidifontibacillus oryziterrae]|uniref:ABC transporter substrate-binding protein n=1 Tax=Calidifontibacillus oryziterrae TaxID=1191699 RepID=UPI0002FA6FAA|nr:ABC transporter substrate-binding protein [Calidifontibacillus oryziterrae]
MKVKNWFMFALIGCLIVLSACSGSQSTLTSSNQENTSTEANNTASSNEGEATSEPIKIGALLPATGVYASLGENLGKGMELYFDSVDWKIGDRSIELIKEDTEADPQVGLRKARKLMDEDKVDILTGTISTAVAYAIRDEVDSKKVPFLVSHAGGNDLTRGMRSDYIYRSSFTSWQIGHSMGQWAYDNVGKKVLVTAADYAFGQEVSAAFKDAFTAAGGEIVEEIYPPLGNNDYASYLAKMNNSGADAIHAFFAGSDSVRFVKQYEEFGLKGNIPLIGSGWLVAEDTRPAQGTAPEGIRASIFWDYNLDTPENKQFVADYEAKFGARPSLESLEGYDAARIIVEALTSIGGDTTDPNKVAEAISKVEFVSPRGPLKFDPETHHVIQNMYILETELINGATENKVIHTIEQVQDPGQ